MTHQLAMYALLRLHADLCGQIKENKKAAKRLFQARRHVEAVLKMFEPGYDLRRIPVRTRKPNRWFKRGTIVRQAIDVLRAAGKPLTIREIAVRMLAPRGINDPSSETLRDVSASLKASLRHHRGKTVLVDEQTVPARWTIKNGDRA